MAEFHLLRPWWLLALLFVPVLWWLAKQRANSNQVPFIAAHLASQLLHVQAQRIATWPLIGLVTLAVLAAAGPSWQRVSVPVAKEQVATVLVVDMSRSMLATDSKPNRVQQAKYKLLDWLTLTYPADVAGKSNKQSTQDSNKPSLPAPLLSTDGTSKITPTTALIAYADEGYVISPLTTDWRTLANLIPSLEPNLMPAPGANAEHGLRLAIDLLKQNQFSRGHILWVTDGIAQTELNDIRQLVSGSQITVNVLAVGSATGAPVVLDNGELLKDSRGQVVVPKLNIEPLSAIARVTGGQAYAATVDSGDLRQIWRSLSGQSQAQQDSQQQWLDAGQFIVLALLPLALLWLRRSPALLTLLLVVGLPWPQPSFADDVGSNAVSGAPQTQPHAQLHDFGQWWQNDEQRRLNAYQQQQFALAGDAQNSQLRGAALYQQGQYQQALEAFSQGQDAQALFNQGNALTQLGRYEQAKQKYDQAKTLADNDETLRQAIDANAKLADALARLEQAQKQQQQQQNAENQQQDGENQQQQSQQSQNSQNQDGQNPNAKNQNGESQDSQKQNGQSDNQQSGTSQQSPDENGKSDENSKSDNTDGTQDQSQSAESPSASTQQNNSDRNRAQLTADAKANEPATQSSSEQQGEPNDKPDDKSPANGAASAQQDQQSQSDAVSPEQQVLQPTNAKPEAENGDEQPLSPEQAEALRLQQLSPEERLKLQQIQQLLRQIPDDPAILLRNKMQLEQRNRHYQQKSRGDNKQW